jgi:AcrR family transcriptional regulator
VVRWQPNARGRLEQAALELYAERGFDQTTVAEIAERAGLTERTFFRHFVDKREVLFWGQTALAEVMAEAVAQAPDSASAMDTVGSALAAIGPTFQGRRNPARQRQSVIAATPSLQERELMKLAALATALTDALRARGVAETTARLAAESGIAVFKIAFERWLDRADSVELTQVIRELLDEFAALSGRSDAERRLQFRDPTVVD